MNYLFFDIECATCKDGGRLCEFGYALTNAELVITDADNILINPACTFDFYVIKKMLNHTEREYRRSPGLPDVYDRIASLLNAPDTLVVGHTTLGDCEHIGDDCIRYGLPVPTFDYVDIIELFKLHSRSDAQTALVKMCEELNISADGKAHSADVDALMTLDVCRALCAERGCSFAELLSECKNCRAAFRDYEKRYRMKKAVEKYKAECKANGTFLSDVERRNVYTYLTGVKRQSATRKTAIAGKRVYILDTYQMSHYTEVLNIIRLVSDGGGETVTAPGKCDIFVDFDIRTADGERVYSKAREKAERAAGAGKSIEFVALDELLKRLGADGGELEKPIKINFSALARENDRVVYNDECGGSPFAELLKSIKD